MKGWRLLWLGTLMFAAVMTHRPAISGSVHLLSLNIPSQPLGDALNEFARQSGIHVVVYSALSQGITAPGLTGDYTPDQALDMLLARSGLRYEYLGKSTVAIARLPGDDLDRRHLAADDSSSTVQRLEPPGAEPSNESKPARDGDIKDTSNKHLEVVTITGTGTNIPGGDSMAHVLTFSRQDFERAGATTAEQFLRALPQNFGGGQTEYTTLMTLGSGTGQPNLGFGTAVNLRGLGSSSTLVLMDGRRQAAGGQAEFTDISLIPLSAVERIEVLPDSAAAAYGSDAVGGVVNFIMRRDYHETETSLRTGGSTHGDASEYDVNQSFGTSWTTGKTLLCTEYHQRDPVGTQDRDFSRIDSSASLYGPRDLVPSQKKKIAYGTVSQDLGQAITLYGDGIYADRLEQYRGWDALGGANSTGKAYNVSADSKEYGIAVGMNAQVNERWQAKVLANVSRNVLNSQQTSVEATPLPNRSHDELSAAEASLSGRLFQLPAGPVTVAAGVSYLNERYDFANSSSSFTSGYDLEAVHSEFWIPVLGRAEKTPLLALSLAGRYENYSSFGSTFNPKSGLRWAALDHLEVHGTYGTSFRAPNAYQLSGFNAGRFLQNLPDAHSTSGETLALIRFGNNTSVKQQTAKAWSFGLDWAAESRDSFHTDLTYFNVDYSNRIVDLSTVSSAKVLDEMAYSNYVLRRGDVPDPEFNSKVESIIRSSRLVGCSPPGSTACTASVAEVGAILDQRLANIAATQTGGVDWTMHEQFSIGSGTLAIDTNTGYVIHYRQRVAATAPNVDLVNTAGNPPRLRIHVRATWDKGNWSASSAINFTNRYSNRGSLDAFGDPLPAAEVASSTTVDLSLHYEVAGAARDSWLDGLNMAVTVTNLFDHNPPYIADGAYGFGFDLANADAFGRQISAVLTKRW